MIASAYLLKYCGNLTNFVRTFQLHFFHLCAFPRSVWNLSVGDPTAIDSNCSWDSAPAEEIEERNKKYRQQCPVCPRVTPTNNVGWHENCGAATKEEHDRKLEEKQALKKVLEEGIPDKGIGPLKDLYKWRRMPKGYMAIFEARKDTHSSDNPPTVIDGMCHCISNMHSLMPFVSKQNHRATICK